MARTPLPRLLEETARDCRGQAADLFFDAARAARQGEEVWTVWKAGAQALPICPQERDAVAALRLQGDEESVCNGISLAISRLEGYAEELARQERGEAQRSTALCFSGAALLVILLI
jgi:stage III sporulation protein AB